MSVSVTLPALGESVTEGTVTRWLKHVGETVQVDEPLLEVSTDKVDTEIPAPASGTLLQITVGEDETVEVGAELGVIGSDSEPTGDSSSEPSQPESADGGQPAQAEREGAEPEQVEQPTTDGGQEAEPASQEASPASQDSRSAPADEAAAPSGGSGAADANGQGTSVTLPALGESVTEGTVTRWLKQVGETVQVDEPLLEVSTDKVDTEIPAPASGTLVQITVGEDETVAVGAELGVIAGESAAAPRHAAPAEAAAPPAEQAPPAPPENRQAPSQQAPPEQAPPQQAPPQQAPPQQAPEAAPQQPAQPQRPAEPVRTAEQAAPSGGDKAPAQYVTPLVRKLAGDHQVDLTTVTGTGVGGRIRKQDVLDAARAREEAATRTGQQDEAAADAPGAAPAAPTQPSPLRGTTEKLSRPRRVIAQRVYESLQSTAQLTTVVEVDITAVARIRDRTKRVFEQREGVKLSFLPFFAKAALEALKEHPKINATLDVDKGEVTYHGTENLVIAVDTERGLMVPVIHDAGDLSVSGLAKRITDLAERTRVNKITPDEISGGTFTITNTGSRGALFDTPIFFQPQVAILGTGTVVKRPVVVDTPLGETIAIRSMVYLALSYDHRLIDGADAARFLGAVKRRLEDGSVAAEFGS
jgi:pyruvate dehydrogenase E2 component (dihydrolipoamide acetyltransferase)